MTTSTNPVVVNLEFDFLPDDEEARRERSYYIPENIEFGQRRMRDKIPSRYANAIATDEGVRDWVRSVVEIGARRRPMPVVSTGPSLLLLGPTGTGKTYQTYGAMRALSMSGLRVTWVAATAADIYAGLRPRPKVDSEVEFSTYANAGVLVIDDLGAAKGSEWTEEINYRLINYRYEREFPTIITSNVPVPKLKDEMGDRVTSRLVEMTTRVVLRGEDRRRAKTNPTTGEAA